MAESMELFFNSSQSSAHASAPTTPTKGLGAQFYSNYMTDLHIRRMRKSQAAPCADAAGLIYGTKFQGRATPKKGSGEAPADNKEATWVSSRALVPGQSFVSVRNLLSYPAEQNGDDIADADAPGGFRSTPSSPNTSGHRTCQRMTDQSYRSSLAGASLDIVPEEPGQRKMKAWGTCAPKVKTARVLCEGGDEAEVEAFALTKWVTQKAEAKAVQDLEDSKRPQTAPDKMHVTEARKYYRADFQGHQDVLRYRHSEGICPSEYKFSEVRQSAPALEVKPTGSAKDVFFDARSSYSYNRVKGLTSTIQY